MRNNKGFTLVELLAVIVILAIVMLIAVTSVGPIMDKARKSAFVDEGLAMVDTARTAYVTEQMDSPDIKATTSVCFSTKWLNENGYFSKGETQGYYGSVAVLYNDGKLEYQYWLTDGAYYIGGATPSNANPEVQTATTKSTNCPGATGITVFR